MIATYIDASQVHERNEEIGREVLANRLAKRLRNQRTHRLTGEPAGRNIRIRWGSYEDETRITELLDLNGMPRVAALGEQFLVAEEDGEVLAAAGYRTASKRMVLGNVIADPWAGEPELAVALYAGARSLAQEIGVREVRVDSTGRTNYPREAGYRRRMGGWHLDLRPRYGSRGTTRNVITSGFLMEFARKNGGDR